MASVLHVRSNGIHVSPINCARIRANISFYAPFLHLNLRPDDLQENVSYLIWNLNDEVKILIIY